MTDNRVKVVVDMVDNTAAGRDGARQGFTAMSQGITQDATTAGMKAGDNLGQGITRGADGRLRDVRGRFVALGRDVDTTMGESGDKAGKSWAERFGSSSGQKMPGLGAAIGAGIAAAGGPAVGAAMVGIGGLGLTALGAVLQKGSPQIQSSWAKFASDAKGAGQQASVGMVAPIAAGLSQLDSMIVAQEPRLQSMFSGAAQGIAPLTSGLVDLTTNALPGMDAAMQHSLPIAQALGKVEGDVGTAIGTLGTSVAGNSRQIGSDLNQVGDTVKTVGTGLGTLVSISTGLGAGALPVLNAALGATVNVLGGVHSVLGPLEPLIGGVALAGVAGWKLMPPVLKAAESGASSLSGGLLSLGSKVESTAPRVAGALTGMGNAVKGLGSAAILGPIVAVGLVLDGLGQESKVAAQNAATAQAQLSDAIGTTAQVLRESNGVVNDSTKAAEAAALQSKDWVQNLTGAGASLKDVTNAALGMPGAFDKVAKSLNIFGSGDIHQSAMVATALANLSKAYQGAVKDNQDLAAASGSANAALSAQQIVVTAAEGALNTYGNNILNTSTTFNTATSGIKGLTDAAVAADSGFFSAQATIQGFDQAVVQAEGGVSSASAGIASAMHGIETAQHAAGQSVHAYEQSVIAVQTAETAEAAARVSALQNILSLQQAVTDATFSQKDAALQVLDAQKAVDTAGLHNTSLASMGGPTDANEAQYKLLLALAEAQQHLAEVTSAAGQTSQQYQQAQAQGVNGSQQVISASQQVANAVNAEQQAHQAVADAQFAEGQAQDQLKAAKTAYQSALTALTAARNNDSRSTDLGTAAGARNFTMIEGLFEANFKATGSISDATTATENQTTAMGFSAGAVDNVINRVTGLNGMTAQFGIVGLPSVNVGDLISAAQQQGLSPTDLGFTPAQVKGTLHGTGRAMAGGGPVGGVGGPTEDANLIWASKDEFMHTADAHNYYGTAFMRAINEKRIPKDAIQGLAGGGAVGTGAAVLKSNILLAEIGGMVGALGNAYGMIGYKGLPTQPTQNPASASVSDWGLGLSGAGAGGGGGSLAASSGVAAAAQAYAASRLAAFGWGPDQMPPLVKLWNQESGWNPWAVNPSSGAYGIPQSLGHGHPYNLGDYVGQVDWGLPYIGGRYGSPGRAWAHEQAVNWYGFGGITGAGLSGVNDRGAEVIRLPTGSQVMTAASTPGAVRDAFASAPAGPQVLELRVGPGADSAAATFVMHLVRSGDIQLVTVANGQTARVKVG